MSIIYENNAGFYISHETYINTIYKTENITINPHLFEILSPYKKSNLTSCEKLELLPEVKTVKQQYEKFYKEINAKTEILAPNSTEKNAAALKAAEEIYSESGKSLVDNALGANYEGSNIIKKIGNTNFVFPENARFFCKDVIDINEHLKGEQFDFIVLDPPWWNKYIRRKRKKSPHAYSMMFNEDLKQIPVETLLKPSGLLAVWCTNSPQHLNALINDIFPKWEVELCAKWYWIKVTKSGLPVCDFSPGNGKQPFEQIIFASKRNILVAQNKLVMSVPSAIHSHKPPLIEMVRNYLIKNDLKCLEIFARYLLPSWTSYGKETIRLQHESLYQFL